MAVSRRIAADVVVIGAGIVGTAIARELSRYDVSVVLVEKKSDVASGTTKANTALVHAGYDAEPGTLKARLNLAGNALYPKVCAELGVLYKNTGSLVVALDEGQMPYIRKLKAKGEKNGVAGLEVISRERILELEPYVNPGAVGALWAPTGGITCPWELAIAYAENAVHNGAQVMLDSPVTSIDVYDGRVTTVHCPDISIDTRFAVNAAGIWADDVERMAGRDDFRVTPRRGEYYLFDKRVSYIANRPLFPVPTEFSKGIVVAPTVDGNLLAGPNSVLIGEKGDDATTAPGLAEVLEGARKLVPNLPVREAITNFAGLRAVAEPGGDFVIGASPGVPNFINAAGIQSPGLTAAPAIAEMVRDILSDAGLELKEKPDFDPIHKRPLRFTELTREKQAELVAEDPRWGHIICRCETVTEAEIVAALHSPVPCTTVDGVKFRTRAGAGRCQGGFCGPRVVAIIGRELGIPIEEVTKKGGMSRVVVGPSKEPLIKCSCTSADTGEEAGGDA
ncbi:MAG: NAD(P)/FAD-dependent oxidoreductase [Bacillota bacterium]|jgi:glycerol-3-phosphate dehydrogenase|nr:NAD(P)/FAD-dependent oxidoreductase [Bacillota bacterium]